MSACPTCQADVLDIDVKCSACGGNLAPTGAQRLIGTTVLAQYRIVDVLGQGGMSVVYTAKHTLTDQDVALKVLPPELAAHAQVKSRFLEEAKALAQLDHPNIVHLYNFGQENGSFVLAMQFVRGQTWERLILEGEGQDWPTATRIAIDVLRGLEYAHGRGIVHRDMKPSNVLVRDDDGTATVMDFGIAKMTTSTKLTATGQTMGTVRYMSPEQVRGHEVDARSDIYSLGAALYEAVVGDTPFDGNTHFEIMSKHLTDLAVAPSARDVTIPAVLEAAIMRSLAKNVDDRFASAREFRKELELALKEADDGYSETMRLSRETVGKARAAAQASPRTAAPVAIQPTPSSSVTAPASPRAVARPVDRDVGRLTSIADQLEPDLLGSAPAKRRTWLWVGLATLVVAAGAAVLVRTQLTRAAEPPAVVRTAKVTAFDPPGVTWTDERTFPDDRVTVRIAAPSAFTPEQIAAAVRTTRARVPSVLAAHGQQGEKFPPELTVLVVPQDVFCASSTFDADVPANCKFVSQYFRPRERTLLVADRPEARESIAEGVGQIVCMYNELAQCFEADLVQASAGGAVPR